MLLLTCLSACGGGSALPSGAGQNMRLFVLLYGYPDLAVAGNDWQRVADAAARVPVTAVINPSSGPLMPPPAAFVTGVGLLRAAGVTVLGYVDTAFAMRPQSLVQQDVDAYQAYGIDGVFFDQVATGNIAYYQALCTYGRSIYRQTILNPGAAFPNAYLDPAGGCDQGVVYENTEANWSGYRLSAENALLTGSQRIALIYAGVNDPLFLRSSLDHAAALGMGAVLVTDRTLPSPWTRLPAYWDQEVGMVAAMRVR